MGLVRCIDCRAWVRDCVVRCGLCGATVRRSKRAMDEEAMTLQRNESNTEEGEDGES